MSAYIGALTPPASGLSPPISYIACGMFRKLFPSRSKNSVPLDLYGSVVAQSRLPAFYRELQIADTVAGRYDMLSLHQFLLSQMLANTDDERAKPLNQEVFDAFTDNIDDALRQLGVGDTSVPKRKKRLVSRFYGHIEALTPALERGDADLLLSEINSRFYDGVRDESADALSRYIMAAYEMLGKTPYDNILIGELAWPLLEDYLPQSKEESLD
ncbi:MAG: ubiquinol-cytochrome C chaperone family protein [Rhizobiaceae bacterium]